MNEENVFLIAVDKIMITHRSTSGINFILRRVRREGGREGGREGRRERGVEMKK